MLKKHSAEFWIGINVLRVEFKGVLVGTRQSFMNPSQSFRVCSTHKIRNTVQELQFNVYIYIYLFISNLIHADNTLEHYVFFITTSTEHTFF